MRRAECEIGFEIDAYANGGRTWAWSHRWRERGHCINCGKTVAQILVPVDGEPPRSRLRPMFELRVRPNPKILEVPQ
jgi:hypothetical protein